MPTPACARWSAGSPTTRRPDPSHAPQNGGVDDELSSAKERGWRELAEIDAALERGQIDEAGWHAAILAIVEPAYLGAETPQMQSGHSGDATQWEYSRRLVMDCVDRDGSFHTMWAEDKREVDA